MHELVKNTFLFLVTVFLFVLFLKNEHYLNFLYIHFIVELFIFGLVIILIAWVVSKVNKWVASLRFTISIQVATNFLIILFLTHELFTPYFYTKDYLKKVGLEKIELYHQLSNSELSSKERDKLAKDVVVSDMAASFSIIDQYPNVDPLEKVEVIEINRNFNEYELLIEAKHPGEEIVQTYEYTFEKEGLDFKIIGFSNLN